MSAPKDYPVAQGMEDLLRQQDKAVGQLQRMPVINKASDILGPGIGPYANLTQNWSDDNTSFNGFYYSKVGAINSPSNDTAWMGTVTATSDGYGIQKVWAFQSDEWPPKVYVRKFYSIGGNRRLYSEWKLEGSPAAYCEYEQSQVRNIPDSVTTDLLWGGSAVVEDPDIIYGNGGTFTPQYPGKYLVIVNIAWAVNGTGTRVVSISRNGVEKARNRIDGQAYGDTVMNLSRVIDCNGIDQSINIELYQNTGNYLAVREGYATSITITRVAE